MTTPTGETASLEIGHYFGVLRRHWPLIVAMVLLGAAAAGLYLLVANRAVTATTEATINVISTDPYNQQRPPSDLIDPDTEVRLASSSEVLSDASSVLGAEAPPATVKSRMQAALVPDTTVMRISYTDDDVETAELGADTIAQAYLDYRTKRATSRIKAIVDQLNQRRDDLRNDLVRINQIINDAAAGSGRAVQAESDRQLINIELNSLSGQINSFLGLDTTGGDIVTAAAGNPTRVAPSRALVITIGLALGLLLGVLLAFLRNALRRHIEDDLDVRRAGGGEVLTTLRSNEARIPATAEDMDSLRAVRELLMANVPTDRPVIAVADLTTGPPADDVPANFAQVVAESGRPVELLIADAVPDRVEHTAHALGLTTARPGGEGQPHRFTDHMPGGGLTLSAPPRGTLVLERETAEVDTGLQDPARHLPIGGATRRGVRDTSPVTVISVPQDASHASLLGAARLADALILVVSQDGTPVSAVARTAKQLDVVGAKINGTVMVPRKRRVVQDLQQTT